MMFGVMICKSCQEVRYRSKREVKPGEVARPVDFDPVGDQPPPGADGEAALCYVCGEGLAMVLDKDGKFSGRSSSGFVRGQVATGAPSSDGASSPVVTLFAVGSGEEVRDCHELSPNRFVVITNKRIVVVDVEAV